MADPMTDERAAEMRKRHDSATPGPWHWDGTEAYLYSQEPNHEAKDSIAVRYKSRSLLCGHAAQLVHEHDAVFIAHARADVPALLNERDRLKKLSSETDASRERLWKTNAELRGHRDKLEAERDRLKAKNKDHVDAIWAISELVERGGAENVRLKAEVERLKARLQPVGYHDVEDLYED